MIKYNSYALSPELKQLACREAGSSQKSEFAIEQAWQEAASSYDKFFMDTQHCSATAKQRVDLRTGLINNFTSCGVWPDTARRIVDECLFGAIATEVD